MTEAEHVEPDSPGPGSTGADELDGPLPDRVRARVVALASDALGRMSADLVPTTLKRVAAFAPARRATLAGSQIASVLAADDRFREQVATDVREQVPDLAAAWTPGPRLRSRTRWTLPRSPT